MRSYNELARFEESSTRALERNSGVADGGIVSINKRFNYQSYLSTTLLHKAVLAQEIGQTIVASTKSNEQTSGYGIGLHPSSETPIAVEVKSANGRSGGVFTLSPGQVFWPNRRVPFSGFSWGLPFGWLGGGVAQLVVFQNPDAQVLWPTDREVIFHRVTLKIETTTEVVGYVGPIGNWPLRFPSLAIRSGTIATQQTGRPGLVVKPTRVLMRLRQNTLAAASTMRVLFYGTDDFDIDSTGAISASGGPTGFHDVTWPSLAPVREGAVSSNAELPVLEEVNGPLVRIGCDATNNATPTVESGIALVAADAALGLLYVDFIRYGTL